MYKIYKRNALTDTYAPELVTLVSSLTLVLRGLNTQPYTGCCSAINK